MKSYIFRKIKFTLKYQFPSLDIDDKIKSIELSFSRKTNRIKSLIFNKKNIFSIRTSDGRFLPSFYGAEFMIKNNYMENTVTITNEAAEFVKEGKSVYCKYIIDADKSIVPGTEVIILDQNRNVLAVGTSVQPYYGLIELNSGVGIRVKHHIKKN